MMDFILAIIAVTYYLFAIGFTYEAIELRGWPYLFCATITGAVFAPVILGKLIAQKLK